jgi:hypothetical protein
LIRLSVGLEDIDDLKADLKAVLTAYSILFFRDNNGIKNCSLFLLQKHKPSFLRNREAFF